MVKCWNWKISNRTNEYEFIVSDINEDQEINILDIVMIIDIIFEG